MFLSKRIWHHLCEYTDWGLEGILRTLLLLWFKNIKFQSGLGSASLILEDSVSWLITQGEVREFLTNEKNAVCDAYLVPTNFSVYSAVKKHFALS